MAFDDSKLDKEQLLNANKVIEAAKKAGINPDFVLPMVMGESGFRQIKNPKSSAFGVMQLVPDTAKALNVDPQNVDENIDGGMRILKELMSNPKIKNDPTKIIVGYNLGTAARNKFYDSGSLDDLPKATLEHLLNVSELSGGTLLNPNFEKEAVVADTTSNTTSKPPTSKLIDKGSSDIPPNAGNPYKYMGAAVGAGAATSIEAVKKGVSLFNELKNIRTQNPSYMAASADTASLQRYLNSQIAPNLRMPLEDLEKLSGGAKIRTASEVQSALDNLKAVAATRTADSRGIYTFTPSKLATDLSAFEYKPSVPQKIINDVKNVGSVVKNGIPSVARVGLGALGGGIAASQLYDAFEDYKKEGGGYHIPSGRTAAKFASGLGGAVSLIPGVNASPLGIAAQTILQTPGIGYQIYDASQQIYDASQQATEEQVNNMLTNVDAMGNPTGY